MKMKKTIALLPALLILGSCTLGMNPGEDTSTGKSDSGIINSGADDGNIATVTPTNSDSVQSGSLVTLNYTLRENDDTGKVIETTVESIAQESGLYQSGMLYQPAQMEIGQGTLIPGFFKNVLDMKKGEKKSFSVPPEEGYVPTTVQKELFAYAPVFTVTLTKDKFEDTITETLEKKFFEASESGKQFLKTLENKKAGDEVEVSSGIQAKIKELTDTAVTLEIENTMSPFYKKDKKVGATGQDLDGNDYKITNIQDDTYSIEVHNKKSIFTKDTFKVGGSIDEQGEKLTIKEIAEDTVTLEVTPALSGKTLHFDVEVVDIN